MAHPSFTKSAELILPELVQAGLAGMEVYYKNYDEETIGGLAAMAQRLGILPLGGSDYHALNNPGEREPGDIPLPDRVARDFLEKELPWVPTSALT
jgi:predicted metal-dependent phosphoesterase TrpH